MANVFFDVSGTTSVVCGSVRRTNFRESSHLPDVHLDLAERLRARRTAHRLSQYDLTKDLGISRASLANWEYGKAPLPFSVGWEICERLDINQRWFVTGEGWPQPFVSAKELGINEKLLSKEGNPKTFLDAYHAQLGPAFNEWAGMVPGKAAGNATFKYLNSLSLPLLHQALIENAKQAETVPNEVKMAYLQMVEDLAREARMRWKKKLLQ